ncbi:hypothetical protein SNE40_003115 [Patella caerulea]|uniref:U6 small nuclear RNA (adenine-(43)-N(6))-methyltransferase n=1 Tax=Patella caerulea TaxID=87958 RepID=A0AAN8QET6_PATCE
MALNRFMHPRNHYRNNKPDFSQLALKYPEFADHSTQDLNGKVCLDFKKANSVRILTQTLLKEDFDLNVELPDDRLTPTLSSRLNYIHWIEDIFGDSYKELRGIDIGTGASCIYPILGCKINNWSFLATDVNEKNLEYANKNVKGNNMQTKIQVVKVEEGTCIPQFVLSSDQSYDFVMCNPPFFADHMEAQAITTTRKVDRPDPPSMSTAEDCESIVPGGEAQFIKQMIQDSFQLKEKIRVFTSMVGKKINVSVIKEELKRRQISNFSTTEFCQGKTMRWGIAWTFDTTIKFPKSYFEKKKKANSKLIYEIPLDNGMVIYDIQNMTAYIISQLQELKVEYKEGKRTNINSCVTMTARENSWSNQRRKRRLEKHGLNKDIEEKKNKTPEKSSSVNSVTVHEINGSLSDNKAIADIDGDNKMKIVEETVMENKNINSANISSYEVPVELKTNKTPSTSTESVVKTKSGSMDDTKKNHLVKCRIILKKMDDRITLEIVDLDGDKRELCNQILQYFKNKLKSQT